MVTKFVTTKSWKWIRWSVLLEMVNFHNYGDFKGLLVRKNYGEFTIAIMVNFALSRVYSKFYRECHISDLKINFLVYWGNLEVNVIICKPNLWHDLLLYKMKQSCLWHLLFRKYKKLQNSSIFVEGIKIFVNKNALKLIFHHNCDFCFSGEFYGEFCLFFSEFWKIFSRSTVDDSFITIAILSF